MIADVSRHWVCILNHPARLDLAGLILGEGSPYDVYQIGATPPESSFGVGELWPIIPCLGIWTETCSSGLP